MNRWMQMGMGIATVVAIIPSSAHAQTVMNCSTYHTDTTCRLAPGVGVSVNVGEDSSAATSVAMAAWSALFLLYLQQNGDHQQQQDYSQWWNTGVDSVDSHGVHTWLPAGGMVHYSDAPAIYAVWGGQLHVFQNWDSYLRYGGHSDLSNVIQIQGYWNGPVGDAVPV